MLPSSFLVVHDPGRSRQDDIPELTRRQQFYNPLLKVRYSNIVSWRDNTCLIDAIPKISATRKGGREVNVRTGH